MDKFTLALISGEYLKDIQLPKEKQYLLKYFKDDLQRKFISYYEVFREMHKEGEFETFYQRFTDHTGVYCTKRWLYKMIKRYSLLEQAFIEARKNGDLAVVSQIQSGKFK